MSTAEVNWVSKLPAASKPAGSNLWPSLPHHLSQDSHCRPPKPHCSTGHCGASPSGQAGQRAVYLCHTNTKPLPRVGFSMCCLDYTPSFVLTEGPLWAGSSCLLPYTVYPFSHLYAFACSALSLWDSFHPYGPFPPLSILQDSVCSPLLERLCLLVLVTWPFSVFSVRPVLTSAAALTLSFKRLHTCYTKDYKLLKGREWVIFISCLAQRL